MGSLFKRAFRRKKITDKEYFSRLIIYIHNNPVHHGFVEDINDWPHSSWQAYVTDRSTKINRAEGVEWFGEREVFEQLHQNLDRRNFVSVFEE
ncbi:hypothetical protein [Fodinibius sediminis]|uniref:Transposase n=1 Tax=Fodinibius sediminis TaxID=1214077 RepID=A0A521DUC5_9BACT|nr:hypothetical protein [Fodinibius sediminis]SMO75245.1 hypothetical protein SAMN06265218_111141 [Fodinibius sediminis]